MPGRLNRGAKRQLRRERFHLWNPPKRLHKPPPPGSGIRLSHKCKWILPGPPTPEQIAAAPPMPPPPVSLTKPRTYGLSPRAVAARERMRQALRVKPLKQILRERREKGLPIKGE